ncbi:MAG: nucleotide exchange factor GrpE [Spirochaetales bacterium]|nr:nucleotide exchange factor GrpE [Spirochaetales bacterium]
MDKKTEVFETKDDEEIKEEVVAETLEEEDEAVGEVETLKKELEEEKAKNAELTDRLLRNQAESENYKKRLLKDKEDAVRYANTSLVKDLLDPIDNFSRALQAADQSKNFDGFRDGVKMIEENMLSLLKNNWGLEVIEEENVAFDPNEHEACLMEEVEGLKEDTVTMLLQKGYKLNGRVIRPAKVKVGKPKN